MAIIACLALFSLSLVTSEDIDCRSNKCKCKQPGHCQIFCDSTTSQCRGSKLRCLPGHPCTIYCLGDGVCSTAMISGNGATHVDLICDGVSACSASKFYCGTGDCAVHCWSPTDCVNVDLRKENKAASFSCTGFCPADFPGTVDLAPPPSIIAISSPTPKPTSKTSGPLPIPASARPTSKPTFKPTLKPITTSPTVKPTLSSQIITCKGSKCNGECDNTRPCSLLCLNTDSCINTNLLCPADHSCTVSCEGVNACNKALIIGPVNPNADFSILCDGTASCGDAQILSDRSGDVLYRCSGKDSCKGAGTNVNCGEGLCSLVFSGEASGDSATIKTNNALGFNCEGRYVKCPDNYDAPCTASAVGCTKEQIFNIATCACECDGKSLATECGPSEVFDGDICGCRVQCALGVSLIAVEADCKARGLGIRGCECVASNYCCLARFGFMEWSGLCWGETTSKGCDGVVNSAVRCEWDVSACLSDPPVNTLRMGSACLFADNECAVNEDCCSEFCRVDGTCR